MKIAKQCRGLVYVLIALAAVLATSAQAGQSSGIEKRTVVVRYGDLDLSKQAGIDTLYQRIRAAAHSACGTPDIRNRNEFRSFQSCYDEALDNAVAATGSMSLAATHHMRTGRQAMVKATAAL